MCINYIKKFLLMSETRKSARIGARSKKQTSEAAVKGKRGGKHAQKKKDSKKETVKQKAVLPVNKAKRKDASAARRSDKKNDKKNDKPIKTASPRKKVGSLKTAQETRKSSRNKSKASGALQVPSVQFDYGVPSPMEEERDSVDSDDFEGQNQTEESRPARVIAAKTKKGRSIRIPPDPQKPVAFKRGGKTTQMKKGSKKETVKRKAVLTVNKVKRKDASAARRSDKKSDKPIKKASPRKKVGSLKTEKETPKSSRNKSKASRALQLPSVQFDYGVPSPIEEERDSVHSDDFEGQNQNEESRPARVIVANTKEGHSIHIPLDPQKPFAFKSELARKLWETSTAERGDSIKRLIENRDLVPDWLKRQLEGKLELTKAQARRILTEDKNRRSGTRGLLWLQLEEKVLDLDTEIRSSLKKEFADVDLDRCISSLDKLIQCPVDPLMLKKYPDLANTPYLLQKYKGFLTYWNFSSEQMEQFCNTRAVVWEKAKILQQRYMSVLGITDFDNYMEKFQQLLQAFQDSVADLTEDEISQLTHEPSGKRPTKRKISTHRSSCNSTNTE